MDPIEENQADNMPELVNAKLWQRILGFLLDLLLITMITIFICSKFLLPDQFPEELKMLTQYIESVKQADAAGTSRPAVLEVSAGVENMMRYIINITIVMYWAYFTLNGMFLRGASLGKRVFKLTVVDSQTYMPASFFQNLSRSGLKSASLLYAFPIAFFINYLVTFFNANRMAGHDYLCRTRVVEESTELLKYQDKILQPEEKDSQSEDDEGF